MPVKYPTTKFKENYHTSFTGGKDTYLGVRQIKDNESPDTVNTDFKGASGIGNREGYAQVGVVTDSRTAIYGLAEYHTSSKDQLVKFASNGSTIKAYFSTGGSWTVATGNTFTDLKNVDTIQATIAVTVPTPASPQSTDGVLFTFNGTDAMQKFDGAAVAAHTGGTKGLYGAYFDKRLWCVDETYFDTLNVSTQSYDVANALSFTADGTATTPLSLTFLPGSGKVITGMKKFKTSLYIFFSDAIYKIDPSSTANQYNIALVTNSVGCVSHRSIDQVEEDLFFAADDGIYSLGEVANFTSIRTTNKSARIQGLFDALSGANKAKLVGVYLNFKYHLFYSQFGADNDTCAPYDIRYKGWLDWHNIAAQEAIAFTNSSTEREIYFGEPTTGKIHKLGAGAIDDDGVAIAWHHYTKSFDQKLPDVTKLYFDTTWVFSSISGTVKVTVIFNDSEIASTTTITAIKPQGGFGNGAFGRNVFGGGVNTVIVTNVQNVPLRMKAKGQKFAVQYLVSSSDSAILNTIGQRFSIIPNKFPSANKIS